MEIEMITFDDIFVDYFICWTCSDILGGVMKEGCHTVTQGKCEYCQNDKVQTIVPRVDFIWPDNKTLIANYKKLKKVNKWNKEMLSLIETKPRSRQKK